MGRLRVDKAAAAAGAARAARDGRWLVKVQPPLDNSSDARGGIGQMTPATLLLYDETRDFVQLIREEDRDHGALPRAALRNRQQAAYLWTEDAKNETGRRVRVVRVHTNPVKVDDEW